MAFTDLETSVWQMVTQAYAQWDPDRSRYMPEEELHELLPAVPDDVLHATLNKAAGEGFAELEGGDHGTVFRPTQM